MSNVQRKKIGRKQLSANELIRSVRQGFEKIPEHRPAGIKISLTDVLMSAFAMFLLKEKTRRCWLLIADAIAQRCHTTCKRFITSKKYRVTPR